MTCITCNVTNNSRVQMPPSGRPSTRLSSGDSGPPAPLPDVAELHDNHDVIAAVKFETEKTNDIKKAIENVSEKIETQFKKVNPRLPLLEKHLVIQKLQRLVNTDSLDRSKKLTAAKSQNFHKRLRKIFDIISCQCRIVQCISDCTKPKTCTGFHVICVCPKEKWIPDLEVSFVKDQRDKVGTLGGKQIMGNIDKKDAKVYKKELDKKEKKELEVKAVAENLKMKAEEKTMKRKRIAEEFDGGTDDDIVDESVEFIEKKARNGMNWNTLDMGPFVAECCRYSISDRGAAALWNAAVKCLGTAGFIETEDDSIDDKIKTDKSKIRREKKKFSEKEKVRKKEEVSGIECLGVDGKRDKKTIKKTFNIVNDEEVEKITKGTEEHVVYTAEPGGEYLTHSTITDGTGKGLSKDFLDVTAEVEALESLLAILLDGTSVNVGWKSGLVAHVERELQRKLLMLSCMLHGNELPLRHLFIACDGGHGTSGPESFAGPLGQLAKGDIHLLNICTFTPIGSSLPDLPDTVWKDLSLDQKILYQYVKAISRGEVPDNLKTKKCGPINHSRWLTLATRLLILYTRTPDPCAGLTTIVTFIQQVYAPMWFLLKKKPLFTDGPAALFTTMQLINKQPYSVRTVVKPVVQHNGWAAEPGTMLCAMLAAEERDIREKAVMMIKRIRVKPPKKPRKRVLQGIRKLEVPTLQWNATTWDQIIDWDKLVVHEPHILERLSLEQLEAAVDTAIEFPKFPLHSQSVERAVKLVTEASSQVYRLGTIFIMCCITVHRCAGGRHGTVGS